MKHLRTIFSVLALVAAFSCTKSHTEGNGQVTFKVSNNQVVADMTKSNVSDYTTLPSAIFMNYCIIFHLNLHTPFS